MRAARVLALQRAFATVVLFGGVLTAVMVADYRERSALPTGITNWGPGGVNTYAYAAPWWAIPAAVIVALAGLTVAVLTYRRRVE